MEINDLKLDAHNFNKHTEEGMQLLEKSITENKFGRSVLVDKDNNIIAGNGVVESARNLGKKKIKVVETTGDELVVVKRTDLDIDSKEGRSLALADNSISAVSLNWDEEEIKAAEDEWGIVPEDWGVSFEDEQELKETEKLSDLSYKGVYYEPKHKPNIRIEDCIDETKYKAKLKVIEDSDLSEEKKSMLRKLAYRFIKIDFESIADYYAYIASEEEKKVLERLRCVLVDDGAQGWIEDDLLKITGITNVAYD